MELLLGAMIVGILYLLDSGRMSRLAEELQEFLDYLERQQPRG